MKIITDKYGREWSVFRLQEPVFEKQKKQRDLIKYFPSSLRKKIRLIQRRGGLVEHIKLQRKFWKIHKEMRQWHI